MIDTETQKWIRCAADEEACDQGFRFDLKRADRIRFFFSKFLRHSKGSFAGKPFELLDWQWLYIIAPAFGWIGQDGFRRFREGYCQVAKKNGKSTLAAGLAIYMVVADGEMGSEVYSAAADREQASLVYNEAASMVEASPALISRLRVLRSQRRIWDARTRSIYRVMSSEAATKEGVNAHCLINDEKHAWKGRALHEALKYATVARDQPLSLTITTAGCDRTTVCYEEYQRAKSVIESKVRGDCRFLAYVAEPDKAMDWRTEEAWKAANPSYGVMIKPEEMKASAEEAKAMPTRENAFKRYRVNLWTEQDVRYLSGEAWDEAVSEPPTEAQLRLEPCFGGLDLSATMDITAEALWWPSLKFAKLRFWCPRNSPKRESPDNVAMLRAWEKLGAVTLTEGKSVDYGKVREQVIADHRMYKLKKLAVDRWNSTQLVGELLAVKVPVVAFGQGFKDMAAPTKEIERLVVEAEMRHEGNPVMSWMVRNLAVQEDAAGNVKPHKGLSKDKIDGVVALAMAIGIAMAEPVKTKSVYDTRGMEAI